MRSVRCILFLIALTSAGLAAAVVLDARKALAQADQPAAAPAGEAAAAPVDQPAAAPAGEPAAAEQPAGEAPAADAPAANAPLYMQEPYDELLLRDGSIVRVQLLDLPERKLPENPRPSQKLKVRLVEKPADEYEVLWREIQEVRFFEQLLIAEAQRLVAEGKFDSAYDFYVFLETNYLGTPGLAESIESFLYAEAGYWQKRGQYDQALALLGEVYTRRPDRAGLSNAMGAATSKLVEQHIAAGDHTAAHRLLKTLAAKFEDHPTVLQWQERFNSEASAAAAESEQLFTANKPREAFQAASLAYRVAPELPLAQQAMSTAARRYPRVIVAVTSDASPDVGDALIDWGPRRTERLVSQRLLEFVGFASQGGKYRCPIGSLEKQDLDTRLVFQIRPSATIGEGQRLTGYDVARTVLSVADPAHPNWRPDWEDLFQSVAVDAVYKVTVRLKQSHVHPESLLCVPLAPLPIASAAGESPAESAGRQASESLGPYRLAERSEVGDIFLGRDTASTASGPREIVEQLFPDVRDALTALRQGNAMVLDRAPPWEIKKLKADSSLQVVPYVAPTVHCLLPHPESPQLGHRALRRAIVYAIDRQAILETQLLRGPSSAAGAVVSGPFPLGGQGGYAYNEELDPRAYDPRLALTLVSIAQREKAIAAGAKVVIKPPPLDPLVLAHPPHDVARVACRSIQRHLAQAEIPVTLLEITPQERVSAKYDLYYAEIEMHEPAVDVQVLFGGGSLLGPPNPYLALALRDLSRLSSWRQTAAKLREIHRVIFDDASVIPLWQLTEHAVYRSTLTGVAKQPVTLYDQVDQWQIAPVTLAARP